MRKHYLKILIATLILLIGIGAVSAVDCSSDDALSFEQDDVVSVYDNSDEILAVADEGDAISASDDDVLAMDDNENVVSASDDGDILAMDDNENVVSASDGEDNLLTMQNNDDVISASNGGDNLLTMQNNDKVLSSSQKQYKNFYLGQMIIPKKYKKYALGYKPSSKNKKAWKQYKAYLKIEKKQAKKLEKSCYKVMLKAVKQNWNFYSNPTYKIKYSGKYMYCKVYCKAYRYI